MPRPRPDPGGGALHWVAGRARGPAKARAATAKWAASHREEIRVYGQAYRASHRKEARAYALTRRAAHIDEIRAADRAYAAERRPMHREEARAYARAYRMAHPEKSQADNRAYANAHREEITAYQAAYRASHRDAAREHYRKAKAIRRGAALCDHPGCLTIGPDALAWQTNPHVCHLCGTPVWRGVNLHMDHVVPISRGGLHCADNLRPACGPCNVRKGARVA